ncbi:hypothetical protein ACP70R_024564 [Stipagrostis hirtigluma subsp. patula]
MPAGQHRHSPRPVTDGPRRIGPAPAPTRRRPGSHPAPPRPPVARGPYGPHAPPPAPAPSAAPPPSSPPPSSVAAVAPSATRHFAGEQDTQSPYQDVYLENSGEMLPKFWLGLEWSMRINLIYTSSGGIRTYIHLLEC